MAGGNDGRSIRPPVNAGGDEYLLTISLGADLGASTGVSARDAFRAAHQWVTRQGSPMACPARRGTHTARQRARRAQAGRAAGRVAQSSGTRHERQQACRLFGAGKCCMKFHKMAKQLPKKTLHETADIVHGYL